MRRHPTPRRCQRGAALLLAMVILTLVTTLAAGMVWQQWRAIEVETAERARGQSAWILNGALDWARLILIEDGRTGGPDHLGEPWAVPLAEARLSTFLAADRNNNSSDNDGIEAFLSGSIDDAQSRYNLSNLVDANGKLLPEQVEVLRRIVSAAGLPADTATTIADGLLAAWGSAGTGAVAPTRVGELTWLGVDAGAIERLRPLVELLPSRGVITSINVNTASRDVLVAAIDGLDIGTAQRIVQARERAPLRNEPELRALVPAQITLPGTISYASSYFIVRGRLRLGDRVLEEESLVRRNGREVVVVQRERINHHVGGP